MNKRNNIIINLGAGVPGFTVRSRAELIAYVCSGQMRANELDRKRCAFQTVN